MGFELRVRHRSTQVNPSRSSCNKPHEVSRESSRRPSAHEAEERRVHDVQAVEKIFAKRAFFHAVRKVAVGGRDDANVDRNGLASTDAIDFAFLNHAKEFGLEANIHLRNLIEKDRSAVGELEFAGLARDSASESTALIAKEFDSREGFPGSQRN